jgi:Ca-activated chloride channel family protein
MIRALSPDELADLNGTGVEAGFGALDTDKGCLPLRSMTVDVHVDGLMAATVVRQRFANVFDEPLEATYIFPLPPRAAVTGFRMTVNGATIVGRIDERATARRDYDIAVAEGRHAAIVEEERPDVFTLRVGNIPPKAIAEVEFTLVAPLAIDALEATYRFPLVVAPRYCPGTPLDGEQVGDGVAPDTDLVPDASRISPPVLLPGLHSPVQLAILARIAATAIMDRAASAVDPVACSLPADETVADTGCRTVIVRPGQRLDRDLILRWKIGADVVSVTTAAIEPDAARPAGLGTGVAVDEAPGEGTFAVTVVPPGLTPAIDRPRDVVFVLDRSGSMGGWKIQAARRAVARMIDSLTARDRVAVLAFDHRVAHRGDVLELAAATDRGRWQLLEWLSAIEARGGTQLAAALAAGLKACATGRDTEVEGRDRFVVLVTDGQVGGEDHVLQTLSQQLGDTRLFVVGIDTAVNEGLLGRMADASGGLVDLVESEGRLDEVMGRIQARIATPLVTHITIEGEGIELIPATVVPARMPDLVPGVPLVLRGRYRGRAAAAKIRVVGRHATEGRWEAVASVVPATAPGLGSLWARGQLRQLEDRLVTAERRLTDSHSEQQIVALSTSFGVLCRFTALVAIDERQPDEPLQRLPRRRIVQPVESSSALLYCQFPASVQFSRWDAFGDGFGLDCAEAEAAPESLTGDSFERERATAARLLARAKPMSGGRGDVGKVAMMALLWGVERLIKRLRRLHVPATAYRELQEAHLAVKWRWGALSENPALLTTLLDRLADVAESGGTPVERWWAMPVSGSA